jgi:ElaB/YqjD/DUF883 family membrane-anchored ribosome-binding protein
MVSQGWWRGRDVGGEMDRLRRDLGLLRHDLGKLTSALLRSGRESAAQRAEHMRDRISHPLHSAYESARDRGDRLARKLEGKFEDHPLISLAGAAMVGMLMAAVLALLGGPGARSRRERQRRRSESAMQ